MAEETDKSVEYKEFSSDKNLSSKAQADLVQKLDDMFLTALDSPVWKDGRKKMVQCHEYREGDQWTAAELAVLQARGQPDTVNNQIAVVINKLIGDLVNQRMRLGFRPRNSAFDADIAKLLDDIFRYIKQANDLEFEERDMADAGFTCGMGVLEVKVTFDDMFQPEIEIEAEDELVCFVDPESRKYDWNKDAKFVARAKWWKLDDVIEMYPQAKMSLKSAVDGAASQDDTGGQLSDVDRFLGKNYIDAKQHLVRVIEVQYKRRKREEIVIFADGQTIPREGADDLIKTAKVQGIPYRIIDRLSSVICDGKYAAGTLLEHKETDWKYFSLVPYFAYRRKNGAPYSLATLALPMQDAVNKRESKAVHLLNTNQVIAERGASNDKEAVTDEIARPDGYVEFEQGALKDGRVQIQRNTELATSQFQMHIKAEAAVKTIMGVDPQAANQTGELRSGSGLQRKFAEASKPVATLFDNIRRTRKILARVILDRVQKYYNAGKIMLITDDNGEQRQVTLSPAVFGQIKVGQYDVIVEEIEDTSDVEQENFAILSQTLPQILPFGPYWTKKLIQLSRLRDKEAVLKDLEAQDGPPPIEPRFSLQANLNELLPVERAFIYQRAGAPEVAEAVLAANPLPTADMKALVEVEKTHVKAGADMKMTKMTADNKDSQKEKKSED